MSELPLRNEPRPIAALYVDPSGPYFSRPGVDPWDVSRDAREYAGPYPVVAHPPCGPWGPLSHFCTKQDPALAPIAVEQVRKWGGVLEHPAHSRLWKHCDLWPPGSLFSDKHGGWSIQVDQVRWGHKARKRTWLYVVGISQNQVGALPPPREPTHLVTRFRLGHNGRIQTACDRLPKVSKMERRLTPPDFAEWLITLARLARRD